MAGETIVLIGFNDAQEMAVAELLKERAGITSDIQRRKRAFDRMSQPYAGGIKVSIPEEMGSWAVKVFDGPHPLREIPRLFLDIQALFRTNLSADAIDFENRDSMGWAATASTMLQTPQYYMYTDEGRPPIEAWDRIPRLDAAVIKEQGKFRGGPFQARWSDMQPDWQFHTNAGWKYVNDFTGL